MVGVGEQRDGQLLFCDELLVACDAVLTNTIDLHAQRGKFGQKG